MVLQVFSFMDNYLSWFIGPKAENASTFEDLLNVMVNDCFHWRKNYFPDDPLLITRSDQHDFDKDYDKLYQNVHEFLAALRRNFPFYNPRYIAHMLSDVTIPSMLGYVGGLLYNPNNVTTEAAPVTTEWEIEACNDILEMIGYMRPPMPPQSVDEEGLYYELLKKEFGWAHIAPGGTLANIEALWVARCAKYLPLSIKDTIVNKLPQLSVSLKTPSGVVKKIVDFDNFDLINIKPSESIYLLSKYIQAYVDYVRTLRQESDKEVDINKASKEAMDYLKKSDYSLSGNLGKLLSEYPLAIFVSGTAHYSIHKAADLLGIGRNNIKFIEIAPDFRMNIDKLRLAIEDCKAKRISPLAVIGIVGTTEEGAIDPIHEICDMRKQFEEKDFSYWIHVDSAWGGYSKTILQLEPEQKCRILANKIIKMLNPSIQYADTLDCLNAIEKNVGSRIATNSNQRYLKIFASYPKLPKDEEALTLHYSNIKKELRIYKILVQDTDCTIKKFIDNHNEQIDELPELKEYIHSLTNPNRKDPHLKIFIEERMSALNREKDSIEPYIAIIRLGKKLQKDVDIIEDHVKDNSYISAIENMKILYRDLYELWNDKRFDDLLNNDPEAKAIRKEYKSNFNITLDDRINELRFYTSCKITMNFKGSNNAKNSLPYQLHVNDKNFVSAYLSFKNADSVTIDPHKQGYLPYPCGVIAFKNDRIRHLIAQDAPYITSANSSALVHKPPLHSSGNFSGNNNNVNVKMGNCISAFAPFILEGSKPGAAAASLWLTNKCIPLTVNGYGTIIRDSLLAARELYAWISNWGEILNKAKEKAKYEVIPLSNKQPDLNVVVFAIMPKPQKQEDGRVLWPTLAAMNELTNKVYEKYSLQVELGNRQYSYGQPFFLSKTTFSAPLYSFDALSPFIKKCQVACTKNDYEDQGLTVLRATLMNPYLWAYKEKKNLNLVREFMVNMHYVIENI